MKNLTKTNCSRKIKWLGQSARPFRKLLLYPTELRGHAYLDLHHLYSITSNRHHVSLPIIKANHHSTLQIITLPLGQLWDGLRVVSGGSSQAWQESILRSAGGAIHVA